MNKKKENGLNFQGWVNNHIAFQFYEGKYLGNDSEKYLLLIRKGLPLAELNKIQETQESVYEYAIETTLKMERAFLSKLKRQAMDFKQAVKIEIARIDKFINKHQSHYEAIIRGKRHRNIKWGAKFVTPEMYRSMQKGEIIDLISDLEISTVNPSLPSSPSTDQLLYGVIESKILFRKELKKIIDGQTRKQKYIYKKLSQCFSLSETEYANLENHIKSNKPKGAIIAAMFVFLHGKNVIKNTALDNKRAFAELCQSAGILDCTLQNFYDYLTDFKNGKAAVTEKHEREMWEIISSAGFTIR